MTSLSELHAIVAASVGVPIGRAAEDALVGRLRHLSLQGFPPMPRTGRGGRLEYGASEVLATALVFDLGQAFVPPATATVIVVEAWPEISLAFAALASGVAQPARMEVLPRGLSAMGTGHSPVQGLVAVEFVDSETPIRPGTRISLDAARLFSRLLEAVRTDGSVAAERFADDLRRAPLPTDVAIPPARLDGRNFYWRRAVELLSSTMSDDTKRLRSDQRLMLKYLRSPMPREASSADEIFDGSTSFGTALEALIGSEFEDESGMDPVATLRALSSLRPTEEKLRSRLLAFAREFDRSANGDHSLEAPRKRRAARAKR